MPAYALYCGKMQVQPVLQQQNFSRRDVRMKVQTVGSISEFLNGKEKDPFSVKVQRHFNKYGMIYKVAGATVIILAGIDASAFANSGLDVPARKLYYQLANIGKWVIVFKGGIDIVKAIGDGDTATVKKTVFSHLLIYLLLLGLPFGMDKVDEVFKELTH
jgi:hypothetical protein